MKPANLDSYFSDLMNLEEELEQVQKRRKIIERWFRQVDTGRYSIHSAATRCEQELSALSALKQVTAKEPNERLFGENISEAVESLKPLFSASPETMTPQGVPPEETRGNLTKINWTETRTQEISQYYCESCQDWFRYESDTEQPPNFCPNCGRKSK